MPPAYVNFKKSFLFVYIIGGTFTYSEQNFRLKDLGWVMNSQLVNKSVQIIYFYMQIEIMFSCGLVLSNSIILYGKDFCLL